MNEELIQALMQSYGMDPQQAQMYARNAQAEMQLAPLQEELLKVNTFSRPSGHAGNILEGVIEGFRRPKVEGRHNEALMDALGSRYGLDRIQAQMEANQQQREQEELEGLYGQLPDMNPAEAGLRARGADVPAPPKQVKPSEWELFQQNPEAYRQYKAAGRSPQAPTRPQTVDIIGEDGATYAHVLNPDGTPGQRIGMTKAPAQSEVDSKDMDIQDALGVLDEAESLLQADKGMAGTGPIQGRLTSMSEWGQEFQSKADNLFQLAKRIYKTKGEGVFTDADAAALRGMLFSANRDEAVNLKIIDSLRRSLQSRSPSFQEFKAEVSGDEPADDNDIPEDIRAILEQY